MTDLVDRAGNPMTKEHVLGTLRSIVAGVMSIDPNDLDVHHSFLDMGVTSLMLMDTIRQVQDVFGVRPAPRKIFEQYWTLDRATEYIIELLAEKSRRSSSTVDDDSSGRTVFRGEIKRFPLSAMQRQIEFFAYLTEQAAAAYRETMVLSLRGQLDLVVLNQALAGVVERHAALRTRLVAEQDVQEVAASAEYSIACVDFSSFNAAEAHRRAAAWHETEAQKKWDPTGPLLELTVLELDSQFSLLVLSVHAAIADRRALYRIVDELATIYSARVHDVAPHLPNAGSYEDYIVERVTKERNGGFHASDAYWTERYRHGIPRLELPADRARPPMQSYRGGRLSTIIAFSLVKTLQGIAERLGTTLHQLSLAAFAVLLSRLTGESQIVIGASDQPTKLDSFPLVANRKHLLPCRFTVDDEQPFDDWLRSVCAEQKDSEGHFDYPLALLVDRLKPERDLARSPLFVVAFEAEQAPNPPAFAGLEASFVTAAVQHARYDLHLTLLEMGEAAYLRCDFSTDIFERQTMRRWLVTLKEMMSAIADEPSTPIHALPLFLDEDRRLIETWNETNAEFPRELCIHQTFERHAARTPNAIAAVCHDRRLTYGELDARANQLAHQLRRLGIGPDMPVGIYSDRSLEMLIGLLGILKAGGAYVPLDPTYPAQRIGFMVDDAALSVIVTRPHLVDRLPEHRARVITLDLERWAFSDERTDVPTSGVNPSNLAYLIYTSGSTGKPKGVEVPHLGAVNVLADSERVYGLGASDVVAAVTTISFDISVAELFLGLAVGAQVVIVPDDVAADPAKLRDLLDSSGATFFQATPSRFQSLLDSDWNGASITAVCGGDILRDALAERLMAKTKVLFNIYGPTETTIWSTRARLSPGSGVTIGRPMANTAVHIVDRRLKSVPIGVPGELCIGGIGVVRGYHRRPELTQEKFVTDTSRAGPGARFYRTGDLARFRPNGDIEFLGRIDHQIKLRGYRIELGEIDSILQRHPAVRQCVTIVRSGPAGEYLVSYFVPSESAPSLPAELREMLRENVPEYMIPSVFVALESLPLTSNGKIDRGALPAPREKDRAVQTHGDGAPRNSIEQFLAKTWCEMLGIAQVGIHDDFFALGGHSLLITRIVLQIRQQFQVGVGPRDFFETPTIAKLGELIAAKQQEHMTHEISLSRKNTVARERFDFLRRDAVLDPVIVPVLPARVPSARPEHVLLTGATGFVGAYIVRALIDRSSAAIHCVARAASPDEGRRRVVANLERWNLAKPGDASRIVPVLGDLTRTNLGLDQATFDALASQLDLIIHSAANVNFVYPYRVLRPVNVGGTQEIIRLASSGRAKPLHYVSTAAVFPMGHPHVLREDSSLDQNALLNLAYDESKWVAEHMLREASRRGLPVAIYRMGEICGDSKTGQTIAEHMIYALIKGCFQLELFPSLDPSIDLVPVDFVADALVHIALQPDSTGKAYHLNNPEPTNQARAYGWIRDQGYRFDVVPYEEWRQRLLTHPDVASNALYPFVGLFEDFEADNLRFPLYDSSNTKEKLAGSDISCVSTFDMLPVMFDYFQKTGFLPLPPGRR